MRSIYNDYKQELVNLLLMRESDFEKIISTYNSTGQIVNDVVVLCADTVEIVRENFKEEIAIQFDRNVSIPAIGTGQKALEVFVISRCFKFSGSLRVLIEKLGRVPAEILKKEKQTMDRNEYLRLLTKSQDNFGTCLNMMTSQGKVPSMYEVEKGDFENLVREKFGDEGVKTHIYAKVGMGSIYMGSSIQPDIDECNLFIKIIEILKRMIERMDDAKFDNAGYTHTNKPKQVQPMHEQQAPVINNNTTVHNYGDRNVTAVNGDVNIAYETKISEYVEHMKKSSIPQPVIDVFVETMKNNTENKTKTPLERCYAFIAKLADLQTLYVATPVIVMDLMLKAQQIFSSVTL
jgi:hypothetical protein